MAKGKAKTFTVTLAPPKGEEKKLPTRNEGEERTHLRNYHVEAASAEDARSLIEEHERKIAEQEGTDPWSVSKVTADQ